MVFFLVEILKAELLKEVKRNQRLKVALRNARFDSKFSRRNKYFLRRQ